MCGTPLSHSLAVLSKQQPDKVHNFPNSHFKYLLLWMLDHNAPSRPSVQDVLQHPALNDVTSDRYLKLYGENFVEFWSEDAPMLVKLKWNTFWYFLKEHPHYQVMLQNWERKVPPQLLSFRPKLSNHPLHNIAAFIRHGVSHCNEPGNKDLNMYFFPDPSPHHYVPSWGDRIVFFFNHESVCWFHSGLALYSSLSPGLFLAD